MNQAVVKQVLLTLDVSQNLKTVGHHTSPGSRSRMALPLQLTGDKGKKFSVFGGYCFGLLILLTVPSPMFRSVRPAPDPAPAISEMDDPQDLINDPTDLAAILIYRHRSPPGKEAYDRTRNGRETFAGLHISIAYCLPDDKDISQTMELTLSALRVMYVAALKGGSEND